MKVLVTGGAGYIGTALVDRLARQEGVEQVILYDNLSRRSRTVFFDERVEGRPVRFVHGDILDSRRLRRALDGVDVVFHLAARVTTPFAQENPHELEQVNHWGTAELSYLLEADPVPRVIYTSSTSVYGASDFAFDVASAPRPVTHYGITKLRGERMLERLTDRMAVYVVRCGNVYGWNRSLRFDAVINRFVFEAHLQGRIVIHGDGAQHRAFLSIDHAARTLVAMGLGEIPPGLYNLVSDNYTVQQIAEEIRDLYPHLEMQFVEPDMPRRDLQVTPDPRLLALGHGRDSTLRADLEALQARFAFSPLRPD